MVLWSALVSSGNYLVSFLNFYQGEKRLDLPQPEQKWLSQQTDWNGKPGSDPPPKSSHVKRDEVSVICSNLRGSKSFSKIQNFLFKLMKEETQAISGKPIPHTLKGPGESLNPHATV